MQHPVDLPAYLAAKRAELARARDIVYGLEWQHEYETEGLAAKEKQMADLAEAVRGYEAVAKVVDELDPCTDESYHTMSTLRLQVRTHARDKRLSAIAELSALTDEARAHVDALAKLRVELAVERACVGALEATVG